MTIAVGQSLPEVTFRIPTKDAPSARTTSEIFKGRRVVLFAVPGAFTPTCSAYAVQALEQHGAGKGSYLILRRIGRCHPWCAGGHDPVPSGTSFSSPDQPTQGHA